MPSPCWDDPPDVQPYMTAQCPVEGRLDLSERGAEIGSNLVPFSEMPDIERLARRRQGSGLQRAGPLRELPPLPPLRPGGQGPIKRPLSSASTYCAVYSRTATMEGRVLFEMSRVHLNIPTSQRHPPPPAAYPDGMSSGSILPRLPVCPASSPSQPHRVLARGQTICPSRLWFGCPQSALFSSGGINDTSGSRPPISSTVL